MTPEEARAVMAARTEGPWYWEPQSHVLKARVGSEGHRRGVGDFALFGIDEHRPADEYDVSDPAPPDADARAIALAVNTWDALMDVADAAREADTHHYESGRLNANGEPSEPLCGECGEDWPCPGDRLSGALAALAARLEAER